MCFAGCVLLSLGSLITASAANTNEAAATAKLTALPEHSHEAVDILAASRNDLLPAADAVHRPNRRDTCNSDTGGTCGLASCGDSRNAVCEWPKCVCRNGQCAINGACVSVTAAPTGEPGGTAGPTTPAPTTLALNGCHQATGIECSWGTCSGQNQECVGYIPFLSAGNCYCANTCLVNGACSDTENAYCTFNTTTDCDIISNPQCRYIASRCVHRFDRQ